MEGFKSCCWRRSTSTTTSSNNSLEPVEIVENEETPTIALDICLHNVIAEENQSITLHCALANLPGDDLTVTWTKDGKVLHTTRRIKIQSFGKDHKLIITSVIQQDQGIYSIMFKQGDIMLFSKSLLFVKPAKPKLTNGVIYLKAESRHHNGVLVQLLSTKVYVGGIIELEAAFKERKVQEYLWFKNNQPLKEYDRLTLFSDSRTAILAIVNAQETDSGIYHVVTKTRYGIDSSYADVLVTKLDPEVVLDSQIIPHIDQHLPMEIEAYEGEEVRMITKISYDLYTDFTWKKSSENLVRKKNIEILFHNNQYISLKFNCVNLMDKGTYYLIVNNTLMNSSTSTSCNLVVKKLPKERYLTKAKILVPLNSAVAYIGSSVVYRCKFEVENPQCCCAIWEVGPYQVERTSNKYCIFCNGTDFFLFIRKVEPDMAGIITCRICKVIPRRKCYSLLTSTARLTIVPSVVTNDIANGLPLAENKTWFYDNDIIKFVTINNSKSAEDLVNKVVQKHMSAMPNVCQQESISSKTIQKGTLSSSGSSLSSASSSNTSHMVKNRPLSKNVSKASDRGNDSSSKTIIKEDTTSPLKLSSLDDQVASSSKILHHSETFSSINESFESFSSNKEYSLSNITIKEDTASSLELDSCHSENDSSSKTIIKEDTTSPLKLSFLDDQVASSSNTFHHDETLTSSNDNSECLSSKEGEDSLSNDNSKLNTDLVDDSGISASTKIPVHADVPSTSKNYVELGRRSLIATGNTSENFTMDITFFRCDEVVYWMDVTSNAPKEFGRVAVHEVLEKVNNRVTGEPDWKTMLQFDWQDNGNSSFAINTYKENEFIESGVTCTPSFKLKHFPFEVILKFRIRKVKPIGDQRPPLIISLEINELEVPKRISILPMSDYITIFDDTTEFLGHGAFGHVLLVQDTEGIFYAAKKMTTSLDRKNKRALREYELLNILQHPNLVKVHLAFHSKANFTLIMDYHWGGDLLRRVMQDDGLSEFDVIMYVRQLCEALHYIHHHGIIHFDIKPANIICTSPNSRIIKVADFGLARELKETAVKSLYVTREYVAPEVLKCEAVSEACDMWSTGVVTYMLLSGVTPFASKNIYDVVYSINRARYNFDHPAFRRVSDLCKDFIRRLLLLNTETRMTVDEALEHHWLTDSRGPIRSSLLYEPRANSRNYVAQQRESALWLRTSKMLEAANARRAASKKTTLNSEDL